MSKNWTSIQAKLVLFLQKYYTDKSTSNAFISTSDVANSFKSSPEGIKRSEELVAESKPSDLDMLKLAKSK